MGALIERGYGWWWWIEVSVGGYRLLATRLELQRPAGLSHVCRTRATSDV